MNRPVIKCIMYGVSMLLLLFSVSEGFIRLTGSAPDLAMIRRGRFKLAADPAMGYELIPHVSYEGAGSDLSYIDFRSMSNRHGFRDRDYAITPPPGTYRILVLGDSITMGYLVPRDADLFTSVLQRNLETDGRPVEVLNFGVSGYNTGQEVAALRNYGLQYKPDLVVLAFCPNDVDPLYEPILNVLKQEQDRQGIRAVPRVHPVLAHSALYRFIMFRVVPHFAPEEAPVLAPRESERISDGLETAFSELHGLSRENGFRVMVAVFPVFADVSEYPETAIHERVKQLCTTHDFGHLDLLNTFLDCAATRRVDAGYYHPNPHGHHCAGTAIAEFIRSRGMMETGD